MEQRLTPRFYRAYLVSHEGRAIARENGVKMGRKFRLNDVQRTEARQRLANGEAASHLAKVYGVSRATIYRV